MPASVDGAVVEQRIVEQAARLPQHCAVTGWAALRWRGAAFFDGTTAGGRALLPVRLLVGIDRNLREHPGSTVSREFLSPREVEVIDGIPVTTVQRALFDEMRRSGRKRDAVVALDMAMAARLISLKLFATYLEQRAAWIGIPLVRAAVDLASEHRRSPQESRMAMTWEIDAGLPRPLYNTPVFTRTGRLLGIPDLLDPVSGTIGEYDGADHRETSRRQRDVRREQGFRDHGLEYFSVVGGDLGDRELVARRMLSTRQRSRFLAPESRPWTLEPPAWWRPQESLDDYLMRIGVAERLVGF